MVAHCRGDSLYKLQTTCKKREREKERKREREGGEGKRKRNSGNSRNEKQNNQNKNSLKEFNSRFQMTKEKMENMELDQ